MSSVTITQLPSATTPLSGTEVLPVVQSGTTKQVSVNNLTAGKAVSAASVSATGAVSAASVTATGAVSGTALVPTGSTVPTNGMYLASAAPPVLGFSVGSAVRATIDINGNFQTGGNGLVDAYGYTLRSYTSGPPAYGITSPGGTSLAFSANSAYRMTISSTGNVGVGTATPSAVLQIKAGTATANTAPLKLTSGTNLTNAEAGAFEYDGSVAYFTPQTFQRGVVPAVQFLIQTTNYTQPLNIVANTAFQLFNVTGATNGTLSLAAGTYSYECCFYMSALPTTSHTLQFGFYDSNAAGSGSAFSSLGNAAASQNINFGLGGLSSLNTTLIDVTGLTNTTVPTAAVTVKGILVISSSTSIQPTLTCTTGGTKPVTNAGSYISVTPLGSSTVKTVGFWS